jgi:hypothetical protein
MSADPRPIEYSSDRPAVSRRSFRLLLALTLINTIMLAWFVVGPQSTQFLQQHWQQWKLTRETRRQEAQLLAQQQQCFAHAFPPETVVYTEDVERVAALDVGDGTYRRVEVGRPTVSEWVAPIGLTHPAEWAAFGKPGIVTHGFDVSSSGAGSIVFLHERRTPRGEKRLVVVLLETFQRFDKGSDGTDTVRPFRRLLTRAYSPFAAGAPAMRMADVTIDLRLAPPDLTSVTRLTDGSHTAKRGPALTIYAGHADGADPTHFTIPYEIDGARGVIDGWVRNYELVMKPRGIPKFDSSQQVWELDVSPPATAQTTAP